ncbi:uncharacterized protein BO88DRAFT_154006 [Aspergillus vadensis CBS 113365]|uniref:Uncharacterized protein n=1 Tax=Aspergillus vadensis (strain CBS 113365 / IMI 142717 / IBT 24658) TaxID=1448311 RepID=A0A319AZ14_ASPVC|nr:hypothetical protein BO88DRAFT_154006 [Aspergillus vadensis CBS 113365]PYH64824.1 hypothetical protein BO88DRAFT_154006 [Aspergillus vadensis CBS 113365]
MFVPLHSITIPYPLSCFYSFCLIILLCHPTDSCNSFIFSLSFSYTILYSYTVCVILFHLVSRVRNHPQKCPPQIQYTFLSGFYSSRQRC